MRMGYDTTMSGTHDREGSMRAGRRAVRLTNPGKLLFPDDGLTKADLAAYYRDVAPAMVPLVRGRPLSLHRFNDGIAGKGFFQQEIPGGAPDWVKRVEVAEARRHRAATSLANDAATLVWLANQNCITPHVWSSRADRLDRPDRMIFDLDPARGDDDWPLVTPHGARADRPARGARARRRSR